MALRVPQLRHDCLQLPAPQRPQLHPSFLARVLQRLQRLLNAQPPLGRLPLRVAAAAAETAAAAGGTART